MVSSEQFVDIIAVAAATSGIDAAIIKAVIRTESNWMPFVCRHEPNYKWLFHPENYANMLGQTVDTERTQQSTSWGFMQIMGAVAREHGFMDYMPKLLDPENNIGYGCKHLVSLRHRFPDGWDFIAAYNAGSPVKVAGGRYANQPYVDKVVNEYNRLKLLTT